MKFQFSVTIKKENSTVLFIGFRCFDVKNVMTFYCLVILSLIFPLSSTCTAQASSFNNGELSLMKIVSKKNAFHQHQVDSSSLVHDSSESTGVTENFRSRAGQNILHRKPRLMRNAHGVLNIIGWGTLLPMGVIISRYFRKFPLKSDDWYPLHMLTTVLLQARREDECRRCWEIYHHVMGYAVICLSIANIFQGIMHQTHAERWKLVYVGILAVLACVVFALEIIRWIIKSRIQQQMAFENNISTTQHRCNSGYIRTVIQNKKKGSTRGHNSDINDEGMAASSAATDGVAAAALRSVIQRVHQVGSGPDRIRIFSVSKTKSLSFLHKVYDAGRRCFAGLPNLAMVETVDDKKMADYLDRMVAIMGRKPLKVFIQVNLSGEESVDFCLKLFSSNLFLGHSNAQASSFNGDELSHMKMVSKNNVHQHQVDSTPVQSSETGMKNVHGVLNIIGWGTLLPTGAIIARYFRKMPLKYDVWYPLHVLCQTSGYIVGSIGWGIGLWLGNSSKNYTLKKHRIFGILIFTFATIQMLIALLRLRGRREDENRKHWKKFHLVLGYVVIALSIVNIFEGIKHHTHPGKWKKAYIGIFAALLCVDIAMLIIRRIKSRT
ncbi:hypothetical protein Pint_09840 [Pistacia integerrima]|uniref:Uncharacterized protein n=1 Tax=Pistacia integerrima TaxID=434235 RepID=A0ACC0XKM8_9ROSI|nr:hypothetical protein Pint_09840 [Pistacia integerrima]